jgi:hypothetical protein
MPVIKVFSSVTVTSVQAAAMGDDLESLCLIQLRAQPAAIQIVFVPSVMAKGSSVLLEMHYRAQPYRDAQALAGFMSGAERSLLQHMGQVPRIRCFSVDVVNLSARN